MSYIEAVFWVETDYDSMTGWKRKESSDNYYRELKGLLEGVGWKITDPAQIDRYPIAEKDGERLEIHSQYLHGTIRQDSPKRIAKLLSLAKTVRRYRVEVLSAVSDMSGAQYLNKLRSEQEEMIKDIKALSKIDTEEFISQDILYKAIEERYHIQRTGEIGEDMILKGVFKNLLSILTAKGELMEGKAQDGETGYRSMQIGTKKAA